MIYYFSATGNSKHVARRLAEALGEPMRSVLEVQESAVSVGSGERMILVYPNYCGGVPYPIADFLQKSKFDLPEDARLLLVITYGNNTGASSIVASKYFHGNTGRDFDAMYSVKMPDNWTPVFDLTDQSMVDGLNRDADRQIDAIIEKMQADATGDFVNDKLGEFMEQIYPGFYKDLSQTSHLKLEDSCVGCGLCAEQCPVGAIEMREGRPHWTVENCAMCLGCLHRCPQFAIQYEDQTKNHGQYLHPDER